MQEALIVLIGILALLGGSIAFPVNENDQLRKKETSNLLSRYSDELKRTPRRRKNGKLEVANKLSRKDLKERIWKFLQSYGYISQEVRKYSKKRLERGIWSFAVWNGAKLGKKLFMRKAIPTFNRMLAKILRNRRCGDPDIGKGKFREIGEENENQKRYVAQTPWGKTALTYKIESFDDDLSIQVQREEIAKAFKLWSDASQLTINEVQGSTTADINIKFVAGDHGDSTPFDGQGFVVAHAFYPEDGRIHFDSDEEYTTGGEANKVNLFSIAAHEIGHALGLGHSAQSDAIMHAQYQAYSPNLGLSQDDINGITYLYPLNNSGGCVDEFWCEDILQNECPIFEQYCKNKCNACSS